MKELFDKIDAALTDYMGSDGETRVSRFYSGENNVVIATKSHDPHTHENIVYVLRQFGWSLYDVGGNGEYHMFTFKLQNV